MIVFINDNKQLYKILFYNSFGYDTICIKEMRKIGYENRTTKDWVAFR